MTTPSTVNGSRFALRVIMFAIYVILAIAAIAQVSRYQARQIVVSRPSLAQFQNVVHLYGVLQGDTHRKGGVTFLLDGRELTCGVTYMGTSSNCREMLPSLNVGMQ